MSERPRLLIEDWLPVAELGIESIRERKVFTDLPPLFALHVWWARRPLVASAGVILASLLPTWTESLAEAFPDRRQLSKRDLYHSWYLRMCGILGDSVAAASLAAASKASGERASANPFEHKRAFKVSPDTSDLRILQDVLTWTWGEVPRICDPTAGGGSIPFEASRYGLRGIANDLNPVAAVVLQSSVATPVAHGRGLEAPLRRWGGELVHRVGARLEQFFPSADDESVTNYLFARTVACPRTGKPVPLSPTWWLRRGRDDAVAIVLHTERQGRDLDRVEFELVRGRAATTSEADRGTVAGGDAVSPWDHMSIDSAYIKSEAHAGRMGVQLYAVVIKRDGSKDYRAPASRDLSALEGAGAELRRLERSWLEEDVLPVEDIPDGNDLRPIQYGMPRWRDMFSPRQLLVHGTFVSEFNALLPEILREEGDEEVARSTAALLGTMIAKGVNFNSYLSSWHVSRQVTRSVFERHDFAFKWTFAEFEGSRDMYGWALDQLVRSYSGIAKLLPPSDSDAMDPVVLESPVPAPVTVTNSNGANLSGVEDKSQTLVCIDPPYYDNVMYAELSDFFYVWEKRTVGRVWPEFFHDELTDKKSEAVANPALFAVAGKRKAELAAADYEAKMQAIFAECHRVLADAGVLTVMFTHKSADAWNALGMALMEAGFTIEASWPVNTESEQSLHQAKKNAAASTIMLVCRKRDTQEGGDFFEDVEPLVRAEARRALADFSTQGISGVDLLLATYGPALSVISSRWPVYSSEADPVTGRSRLLRPEEALDAARAEVARLQRSRLVGREQALDPLTDFAMVAWDTFKAVEFPFDEARRLALAIGGLDIEELRRAKVLEKKSGTVLLLPPAKRVRRDADFDAGMPGVYPEATSFMVALDGVHTAIYIADVDGLAAAKAFLDRAGLASDARFLGTLQGLVNAIPRSRVKGEWVVPEAETLDRLRAAYFPDIKLPLEPEVPSFEQASLLGEE